MNIRHVAVAALALGLLVAPVPSPGQQPAKVYRIGWLGGRSGDSICPTQGPGSPAWQAFVEGLREHGFVLGQNVVVECRFAEGRDERGPALAAELVALKPDLLVVSSIANTRAAMQATHTIPIVMVGVIDPVERGLVSSIAHPGGNVTGLSDSVGVEIYRKRLQILKEAAPQVSRLAVLGYRSDVPTPIYEREETAAAVALHLTLQTYRIRAPEEIADAFTALTRARAEGFLMERWPIWWGHEQQIIALAAQHRLPGLYPFRELVEAGGLLSYDVNRTDRYRRLGFYVDKIFRGTNPADLPVERPTKFELVINLKSARALGLTIPSSLLSRADEVIQ